MLQLGRKPSMSGTIKSFLFTRAFFICEGNKKHVKCHFYLYFSIPQNIICCLTLNFSLKRKIELAFLRWSSAQIILGGISLLFSDIMFLSMVCPDQPDPNIYHRRTKTAQNVRRFQKKN